MSWSLNIGQTAQQTARSDSQQKTKTISKESKYFLKSIEPYLTSPPTLWIKSKVSCMTYHLGGYPINFPCTLYRGHMEAALVFILHALK